MTLPSLYYPSSVPACTDLSRNDLPAARRSALDTGKRTAFGRKRNRVEHPPIFFEAVRILVPSTILPLTQLQRHGHARFLVGLHHRHDAAAPLRLLLVRRHPVRPRGHVV